jgi:hypothetical protein
LNLKTLIYRRKGRKAGTGKTIRLSTCSPPAPRENFRDNIAK